MSDLSYNEPAITWIKALISSVRSLTERLTSIALSYNIVRITYNISLCEWIHIYSIEIKSVKFNNILI